MMEEAAFSDPEAYKMIDKEQFNVNFNYPVILEQKASASRLHVPKILDY